MGEAAKKIKPVEAVKAVKAVEEIMIEKNIPVPAAGRGSKWEAILRKMSKGDSVLIKSEGQSSSFMQVGRKNKCVMVSRKVEGGTRVWMTKKGIRNHG